MAAKNLNAENSQSSYQLGNAQGVRPVSLPIDFRFPEVISPVHHREGEDDGLTHRFHFDRIRRKRKYGNLHILVAKSIVVFIHLSVLICVFAKSFQSIIHS
jgi:hypothetical protein